MSAGTVARGRSLLASALERAAAFVIEPAAQVEEAPEPRSVGMRPVVGVVGLAPGCGATMVARALATELGARDAAAAALVIGSTQSPPLAPAGTQAGRLARALATVAGGQRRVAGRLCLASAGTDELAGSGATARLADAARPLAPIVIDAGDTEAAGVVASLSERVVLVASPLVEPALATVVAASLERSGPAPVTVLNRVDPEGSEDERWTGRADFSLFTARAGARLALAGRDARRSLGPGLAQLADACGEAWGDP